MGTSIIETLEFKIRIIDLEYKYFAPDVLVNNPLEQAADDISTVGLSYLLAHNKIMPQHT